MNGLKNVGFEKINKFSKKLQFWELKKTNYIITESSLRNISHK